MHKRQRRVEMSTRTHKRGGDDKQLARGKWTQKKIGEDNKDAQRAKR